ncbi:MAG TPA: AI-2E family transporter [Thiolapillus brandeum]|uniref:AI-2E family transporter n=1 Tax=Thiolapillus brandeum TaxID=1076588 RepID=A0A831K417_9GAMM|nr:AI-2E family transporter [Thiolapillus brandeum]
MPQKLTATVVTLAAIIALLVIGKPMLIPFAIALIIWYIIDAIAMKIRRLQIGSVHPFQRIAVFLALVVVVLLLSGVVQMIGGTLEQVRAAAPEYQHNVSKIFSRLASLTGIEVAPAIQHWADSLDMGSIIGGFATAIMGLAGNAGLVAIYVIFLLLEERYFNIKLRLVFSDAERRKKVKQMLDAIQIQIRQYVYIKTMVSALTGIVSYVILLWVGVDYAPFWALLIFMLNYIPTIGSMIAVLLPTALSLVQFETLGPFLTLLVSLGTVQILIGNVLEPRLMGSSLNLSPLVVILALSLWGQMWGVTGMFLSVPITVIGMIVLANFPQTRSIAIAMSENGRLKINHG